VSGFRRNVALNLAPRWRGIVLACNRHGIRARRRRIAGIGQKRRVQVERDRQLRKVRLAPRDDPRPGAVCRRDLRWP
jgi:hypothetical protein